jgi:hypothetical protein
MFNTQAFDQVIEDIKSVRLSTLKSLFSLMMGHIPKPHLENPVFQDPEGSQKPFAPHYEQFIKPEIDRFEHQRIATLKSFGQRCFGVLCLLVAIGVMVAIFKVQGQTFHFFEKLLHGENASKGIGDLVSILFITLTAIMTWCYLPVWRYKGSVKKTIFPPIFKFFGENFDYSPEALMGIEPLESSEILPAYNRSILTDSVRGSHQNVILDIVWAHLKQKRGKSISTVFKGLFVCLSMNKWFSGKTIVKRDRGLLMNWAIKKPEGLEKVNLEDPRFEKDFEVYASNQIEARYLLTPSFMERLQGLSDLFGKTDIQASFYNQNLLLMIPLTKRYFDTGSIFQPATFTEEIQSILEEMNLIFKIIEELKLHEKTGV